MSSGMPLRVLQLEDEEADAELALVELGRAGYAPAATRVDTEAGFKAELSSPYDVILADYGLPQYDAERALRLVQDRGLDVPFIVVSGTIGEERAAAIVKDGASDYLLKDRLGRLGSAVRQALEQRALRREKEHAERRFQAFVEHAADIIAIIDARGTLRYVSPALERVLGYEPEQKLGAPVIDWVHPEDARTAREFVTAALSTPERSFGGELRVRDSHGDWCWIEAIATNLPESEGQGPGVVINARDISERRRMEVLRAVANESAVQLAAEREHARYLEELGSVRADFTAMVAHELNSRVAAIRRYADVATIDPLSPIQQEAMASIQSEVVSLQTLIGDAHAAATVDRDDFAVHFRPVPVEALLNEAVTYARTLFGDHPLETEVEPVGTVYADPARIGQVLRNLLSNAAKYSAPGSPVSLRVHDNDNRACFEVADQGYGIGPEDRDRIFEKYGRGRDTAARRAPGIGLGLYLSRRIVQAHGSDLTVVSTPGRGSTFRFELEVVR